MSSQNYKNDFIAKVLNPEHCVNILISLLFFLYVLLPLIIYLLYSDRFDFLYLAFLSFLGCIFIYLGSKISLFDFLFKGNIRLFSISGVNFIRWLWIFFIAYIFAVWATAEKIPLLAAISGADPETVAVLREQFLKAREGWQSIFVYINAIFSAALIPYSIAMLFTRASKFRWICFLIFFIYTISFLEKVFFLRATIPLIVLISQGQIKTKFTPKYIIIAGLFSLLFMGVISGSGNLDIDSSESFFSIGYIPKNVIDHLVWRSISVPVTTAGDAMALFTHEFHGELLLGATSNLITGIFGFPRIEFERLVFAYQWGQNFTGTGSSNALYIIEAFINFGFFGVVLFSIIIGLIFRFFRKSNDLAFKSIWPLFAFGILVSGLLGQLFSNGFLLLFILIICINIRNENKRL